MITHSLAWVEGELHEMRWLLLGGTLLAGFGLAAKLLATTPGARAVACPLLVLGAATLAMGAGFTASNLQRRSAWPVAYAADPVGFAEAERRRVTAFTAWYPRTRYVVAAFAVVALGLMIHAEGPRARPALWGWGFALFLFAGFTFLVDHFSEERARAYAEAIGAS